MARTIIVRPSSFQMGNTSSITPEARRRSAGSTSPTSTAPGRNGCSTRMPLPSIPRRVISCSPGRGELLAQPFDAIRLTLNGESFHVADRISVNPSISLASLSASATGTIAFGTGSIRRTQFAWFDRSGKRLETVGGPGPDRPRQSDVVARRPPARVQPLRGRELGHLADRHAGGDEPNHVKPRPRLQSSLGSRWPPDSLPVRQFRHRLTIRSMMVRPSRSCSDGRRCSTHRTSPRTAAFFSIPGRSTAADRPLVRVARRRSYASAVCTDRVSRTRRSVFT